MTYMDNYKYTHIPDNKSQKRCLFVKESGDQCGAAAMRNSVFCYFHAPEATERRKESRRNGGKKKVLVTSVIQDPIVLNTPRQVTKFYSQLIIDVMNQKTDLRFATGIGYLLNGLLKAMELSEFERRIEKIETKISQTQHIEYE